jgi:hypothetical protein
MVSKLSAPQIDEAGTGTHVISKARHLFGFICRVADTVHWNMRPAGDASGP